MTQKLITAFLVLGIFAFTGCSENYTPNAVVSAVVINLDSSVNTRNIFGSESWGWSAIELKRVSIIQGNAPEQIYIDNMALRDMGGEFTRWELNEEEEYKLELEQDEFKSSKCGHIVYTASRIWSKTQTIERQRWPNN